MKQLLKANIPLIIILLIGLFFRIHNYTGFFQYSHEQDLQAWIIKDIVVDHHFRLIGQETSITGVFIGPLYYYVLAFFFMIFSMNPLASIIPVTLIGLFTIASIYFVFTKLFGKEVGYIGSFLYAVSIPVVFLDRWAVPTQPTLLWVIWFFYVLMTFAKGKFNTLPILILLIALIWHIHIAFIPLMPLVLIAIYFSRKPLSNFIPEIKKRKTLITLILAIILLIPFFAFEIRHGFQQTKSILIASHEGDTVLTGKYKEEIILQNTDRVLTGFLYQDRNLSLGKIDIVPLAFIAFLCLIFLLYQNKSFTKNEAILIALWIATVIIIHSISKRPLSEYYFNNLIIVSLAVFSVLFGCLYRDKKIHNIVLTFGVFILLSNTYSLLNKESFVNEYQDKSNAVQYIAKDSYKKNFPCIAITYIGKIGVEYGYRYLFWLNKVKLATPGTGVPVYNLAIPSEISPNEVVKTFGTIGVILPKNYEVDPKVCDSPTRQLEKLNGFVN